MEVDAAQTESASPAPLPKSPQAQVPVTTSSQVEAARASVPAPAGSKSTAPLGSKMPPPIFVRKLTLSKYPQIVPVCGLIHKSLDNKVQFHTYARRGASKWSFAVSQPDFLSRRSKPISATKASVLSQDAAATVRSLAGPRGPPRPMTKLSRTLVNAASRVSEWNPHKGGPGQCHRCQLYGHTQRPTVTQIRVAVKCQVPHWTRDCPLTRDSEEKPLVLIVAKIIRLITDSQNSPTD
ncbi:hypothetical protein EVAR_100337_1 [Eumeta japonica]|uniref:Uncharacterized protein n=1 Tax=Eumeta variegata TaxID=151549 RepID=A0A4C1T3L1_EUMVA|nr:hypothetical protein EVAR_100337_1 [Eumeta japonica]